MLVTVHIVQALALLALTLCTVWTLAGLGAVLRTARLTRRRKRVVLPATEAGASPGVSVLKPLCGADPGLARNLEGFFLQSYPEVELIFGVQNPSDPAIPIVRALQARYPHVPAKLVVHDNQKGINPKVRNLLGMLPFATHDLLVISDSNVRAPSHYLSEMVRTWRADPDTGLVTNLFAGRGEDTLGAALENVQLNGFCAAGSVLPTLFGDALVVGKSMLFSRKLLDELGGLERVADVLAEDFVMGKLFQHAGYRVRVARTVLSNVTSKMSVSAFLQRHLRWAMLRWRLRPVAFVLEPLTSPLLVLPVAWMLLGGPLALLWVIVLLSLRDVGGWVALRGWRRAWIPAVAAPVREVAMLLVWLRAPFKRHITWRGNRVRLTAGTLLFRRGVVAH